MGNYRGTVGTAGRPGNGDWKAWKPREAIVMRAIGNDGPWARHLEVVQCDQFLEVVPRHSPILSDKETEVQRVYKVTLLMEK